METISNLVIPGQKIEIKHPQFEIPNYKPWIFIPAQMSKDILFLL